MRIHLSNLVEHAAWANRKTLEALRAALREKEALRLFAHILTTERIYLERIQGLDPFPQDFWPDLEIEGCAALVEENPDLYRAFLHARNERQLALPVRYRNSRGEVFRTPVDEMLTHLALHGEHHRGQIARILRQAGREPPVTDFITFVRERAGEGR